MEFKYYSNRLGAYAYFHGIIKASVDDICCTSRAIIHDGNYEQMYKQLIREIKEASTNLKKELEKK